MLLSAFFQGWWLHIPSRCGELDVAAAFRQFFPSHPLDDWPVLPNEMRRILKILSLHFDTASLPASATRYLEIERVIPILRLTDRRLPNRGER